ncbi:MAG: UDP-N-acetylmuramoyl-L-alanyl-D-glutamate--2,6-diaminopimelate ligase [Paracoccaceae bacterium]|nr:UDP-N-acetylmuramoyl-L-alanyl-D-glutamate--2,6-diaminopimelate ligase [Paracoccaceae bacterium]
MPKHKSLSSLGLHTVNGNDPVINKIVFDSRQVEPGCLFAALKGSSVHGAEFVEAVLDAGAVAILTDKEGETILKGSKIDALVIKKDARRALAKAVSLLMEKQPETIVAITGTNGKTSVATFCRQIWNEVGIEAINIGTTGVEGSWSTPLNYTTPDPVKLHQVLYKAASEGITHIAMEASSHGLDQRRLDGVEIKTAAFTNFSRDHLDYHTSYEDYFNAKKGLFERLCPKEKNGVFNIDNKEIKKLAHWYGLKNNIATIGYDKTADLIILSQKFYPKSQDIRFSFRNKIYQKSINLIGAFQAENLLMAALLVISSGQQETNVFEVLEYVKPVRGRMELAATRQNGATVYVDYAHTPDAVEIALKSLKPHILGKLIVVIGAGGERDEGKRPLMGAAAEKNSDFVIITDDNPRNENPSSIHQMIENGIQDNNKVTVIPDRAEAILKAVDLLDVGDGLLIAGKGHETEQIVGKNIFPFDDFEQASLSVASLDGVEQ